MKNHPEGFTIVELMIVVGIIGVIAAIAIPLYSDYLNRSKVAETLLLLGGLKIPMVEYYDNWGRWPSYVTSVGGKVSGRYVSQIDPGGPTDSPDGPFYWVEAIMKGPGELANKKLRMTYTINSKEWKCTRNEVDNPIDDKYLPTSCRQ